LHAGWHKLGVAAVRSGSCDKQLFYNTSKLVSFPEEYGGGAVELQNGMIKTKTVRIKVQPDFP